MLFFVVEFVVYWPPVKDTNLYKRMVKRQEQVDGNTWKLYSIQKVFCETGKYIPKFEIQNS